MALGRGADSSRGPECTPFARRMCVRSVGDAGGGLVRKSATALALDVVGFLLQYIMAGWSPYCPVFCPPPPLPSSCSVGRWFECVSRGPIRPRPLRVAVCTPSCPDGRRMQPPLFAHRNIRSPAANAACDEVVQGGPMWWLCD